MSEENVEIVRRVMDAEARRDEAMIFALYDENIAWDATRSGGPISGHPETVRGHNSIRTWFRSWYEGFADVRYEVEELIDAGDHVFAVICHRGRGRASGVEVQGTLYGAWTIRDGKVVRVAWFQNRDEALEAAGLRE